MIHKKPKDIYLRYTSQENIDKKYHIASDINGNMVSKDTQTQFNGNNKKTYDDDASFFN